MINKKSKSKGMSMKKMNVNFKNLDDFNAYFEMSLTENQVKFKRFSRNVVFIEGNVLFFTMLTANPDLICKVIKRYYGKYFIYLLLLKREEYNKLCTINAIHRLDCIKLLNCTQFSQFDITTFNKHLTDVEKKERGKG